jgi:hypothetical protein
MPNTFVSLDVPRGDGVGAAVDTALTGHPKSFVLAGPVRAGARYVVEGSNDGGATWDILVDDDDGTEVFFTSRNAGAKSADCIVGKVRVRATGAPRAADPPSLTMGAPPATGTSFFATLDVPLASGLGAPLDLGLSAGPLKTVTVRGRIPPGSRYTVLASMDGVQFDEVLLFTADQQGTRSRKVMCRFLRIARAAGGPTPAIAIGAEGLPATGDGGESGLVDLTLASEAKIATTANVGEELLAEYLVPLQQIPSESIRFTLTALARLKRDLGAEGDLTGSVNVRLGGSLGVPDGDVIATVELPLDLETVTRVVRQTSFARPIEPASLVKLTGQSVRGSLEVRGFVLWFQGR